ncbi:MAG: lipoprotein [Nocardioides sp.]|nr:lipoprotein [Nocardioides sp.]
MRLTTATSAAALVTLAALAVGCSSSSTPSSTPTTNPSGSPSPTSGTTAPSSPGSAGGGPSKTPTPSTPHATEFNPPGDIPDNAVYVDHVAPGSKVHFTVPEGWAKSTSGGVTTFTDKYNSISIEVRNSASAPTVASARKQEVPKLQQSVSNFALGGITTVSRQHGTAVQINYQLDSAPNPVTDKVVRDAAQRFEFWHAGEEAILTLTGPTNADNVDPWQIVSDSLQWK